MATPTRGVSSPTKAKSPSGLEQPSSSPGRRISLEEVAAKTKISIRFLRAIQAEDYKQLPGGIFATSYIRQYAAALGLDPEPLVQHYHQVMTPPAPKPPEPVRTGFLERLFRVPA